MDERQKTLAELHSSIEGIDKEITMILQNLQWDRKHLLEGSSLVSCMYDSHHRVPTDKKLAHEDECFLRRQGYASDDVMLPDPLDETAPTIVKLCKEDITQIINRAAQEDPSFKRGPGPSFCAPRTAERVQASLTADERRAIHDAVVSAAPGADHVHDLPLPGTSDEGKKRPKTKLEVLAELRDMRRRRTKYRGANSASNNYSNVLRDVIKTQMELFTGVKEEPEDHTFKSVDNTQKLFEHKRYHGNNGRDDRRGKHRDENTLARYEDRYKSGDRKHYDGHKEKHRSKDKDKHKKRYDDEKNDGNCEVYIKKEPVDYDDNDYYEEEHGDTSYQSRHKRNEDAERRNSKRNYRDRSESRNERSYRSDKYYESSNSRSDRRYKEEYKVKLEDTRSPKRHREIERERHDDIKHSRHHDSSRRDKHTHDKKRKRHS